MIGAVYFLSICKCLHCPGQFMQGCAQALFQSVWELGATLSAGAIVPCWGGNQDYFQCLTLPTPPTSRQNYLRDTWG